MEPNSINNTLHDIPYSEKNTDKKWNNLISSIVWSVIMLWPLRWVQGPVLPIINQ